MMLLSQPEIQSDLTLCPAFNGKPVCCTSDTFTQFADYYKDYDNTIDMTTSAMMKTTPEQRARIMAKQLHYNTVQEEALINLITLIQSLYPASLACQGGLHGYQQGMMCFSCDPDWENYFDAQNNILNISTSTCDSVWNDCSSLMQDIDHIAVPALGYIITMINVTANASDDTANVSAEIVRNIQSLQALINESGSVCPVLGYEDCKSLICDGTLHGLEILPNLNSFASTRYQLQSVQNQKMTQEAKVIMDLLKPFVATKSHNFGSSRTLLQALQAVKNLYPTDSPTYDAFSVGCESKMSKYACPTAHDSPAAVADDSPSAGWIVGVTFGVLSGVCVLASAVFLALKFRHRRKPLAVQPPSHLDDFPPSAPEPRESETTSQQ